MKSIFNKTNAPYFFVSALAIGTLLVSGVFAAAPYVVFLAPVTALGIGLPFIIGAAAVIALSVVIISKNNTISEKGAQLASQAQEINAKDRAISEKDIQLASQAQEINAKDRAISEKDIQLASQAQEINAKDRAISEKDIQLASQAQEINAKDRAISEKDIQLAEKTELITTKGKKIAEDRLKVEIADSTVWLTRGIINCTVQLAKGAFNGALHCGKHTYNNLPSAKSVTETFNNSYGTSVKYTKEAFNSVGNGLKSVNKVAVDSTVQLAKGAFNGALHCGKHTYNNLPSAKSVTETFNNSYGTSVKYTKEAFNSVGNGLKSVNKVAVDSTVQLAKVEVNDWKVQLLAVGLIATYAVARFGVINNSLMQFANSVGDHTLSSNLPLTYSSLTHQQTVQSKVDEATKRLADANNWYEGKYVIPVEDSTSHKDVSQGMMSRIFSVLRNPWDSLVGSAKKNDNSPEPQWYKDLNKSEGLEEIIDGGTLGNLFYPEDRLKVAKVDNGINTSRQAGTCVNDIELERLIREAPISAYSNGVPRVL